MIRNPNMVYKVYEQIIVNEERLSAGTYTTEVLKHIVHTPEEVIDVINFDKWFKVKYVVDDGEQVTHNYYL